MSFRFTGGGPGSGFPYRLLLFPARVARGSASLAAAGGLTIQTTTFAGPARFYLSLGRRWSVQVHDHTDYYFSGASGIPPKHITKENKVKCGARSAPGKIWVNTKEIQRKQRKMRRARRAGKNMGEY